MIVPLVGTLTLAAMLLIMDKMRRLFDFVAAEGGPVSVVWRMLANLIPEYLSLGIPIGLLLGILLAFRKLALSSELDVLRAVGLGYGRLLRVPFCFAMVLAVANMALVGFIQPKARYAYEELGFELRSGALGASIKVGEFTKLGEKMTMHIEESRNKGQELKGIFIRVKGEDDTILSVTAEHGQFMTTNDRNTIVFRLTDGLLVHDRPNKGSPRILSFSNHNLPIDLPQIENFRGRGGKDREYTLPELYRLGQDISRTETERNQSRANFHFRLVEMVMMFLMPLLAIALAIPPKRSTSAVGVFLSIIMIVTYHKVNQYGEGIGALGIVDPIIALWGPFLVFAAIICTMYYRVAYVPGGQAIGGLEKIVAKSGQLIKGLLSFGRRRNFQGSES